ncbi:MAG: haloacid dehalogenase-like hydrolase [Clostridia bacterium]|nr:haloacid dehalogenase-like hydrolase [Clostridia bacterium]
MKKVLILLIVTVLLSFSLVGCNKQTEKEYFTLWNECDSLKTLKEFVEDVTNPNSKNFIPVEDRIATFDMDGTFIGELYPTYFEYNLLEYRVLDDPDYKDIAPADVVETAQDIRDFVREGKALPAHFDMKHAYAAAKAYAGMTLKEFDLYVKEYAKNTACGFRNMTYADSFYKPMLEIFDYLEANNFTYYVVSGSDRFICRSIVESIGIAPERVIGMDVVLKSDNQGDEEGVNYTYKVDDTLIRTDELIIKNLKTNKVKQIAQEIGKVPVLSFGNSSGDSAMHNYCLSNEKYKSEVFMLIADDEVRDHADLVETAKRKAIWEENNYNIISMKNDFKTIYGINVVKTQFDFNITMQAGNAYTECDIYTQEELVFC